MKAKAKRNKQNNNHQTNKQKKIVMGNITPTVDHDPRNG